MNDSPNSVICPHCQAGNYPSSATCWQCGQPLRVEWPWVRHPSRHRPRPRIPPTRLLPRGSARRRGYTSTWGSYLPVWQSFAVRWSSASLPLLWGASLIRKETLWAFGSSWSGRRRNPRPDIWPVCVAVRAKLIVPSTRASRRQNQGNMKSRIAEKLSSRTIPSRLSLPMRSPKARRSSRKAQGAA